MGGSLRSFNRQGSQMSLTRQSSSRSLRNSSGSRSSTPRNGSKTPRYSDYSPSSSSAAGSWTPRQSRTPSLSSSFGGMAVRPIVQIPVSSLYYSHGPRAEGADVQKNGNVPDMITLDFQEGRTPEGQIPTLYDTAFALLVGNAEQPRGILQRLVANGFTKGNITSKALQEALGETNNDFRSNAGWGCVLEVVNIAGRNYSNNNRSLYVMQMIQLVFPGVDLYAPCQRRTRLSDIHAVSDVNSVDGITVVYPNGWHARDHPARTEIGKMFTLSGHALNTEYFLTLVQATEAAKPFFEGGDSDHGVTLSGTRRGRTREKKKLGKSSRKSRDA